MMVSNGKFILISEDREKGLATVVQPEPTAEGMKVRQTVSPDKWEIELSEENVAVLDHFCTETIKEPMYVLALDDKLHEDLGMEVRNFMMPQPWCRKMDMTAGGYVDFFADFDYFISRHCNFKIILHKLSSFLS